MDKLWGYELQVMPVLIAFILFQLPSFIHKLKKEYYVPVYFSIYPFSKLNNDLSKYLGDNFFCEDMDDKTAEKFRNDLILKTTISLSVSVLLIPIFVGFTGAFYLTVDTLWQFLILLSIDRTHKIVKSLMQFHGYNITSNKYRAILAITYFFYLGIILTLIFNTFIWANKYVVANNYIEMVSDLWNFIFVEMGIKGIIVIMLTTAFTNIFANREIRRRTTSQDEE